MNNNIEIFCPKCNFKEFWQTKDKRLKCKNCRFLFTPRENSFNISNEILGKVISEFILGGSTNTILQRVEISKYKLLIILTHLRKIMANDIPKVFGHKKSLINEPEYSFLKNPIIGVFSKNNYIYAKILEIKPCELKAFLKEPIKKNEPWMNNLALIYNGSFYRLLPKEKKETDCLDAFWDYFKRKTYFKGGIRKEKLPLYVAEYVWRFNHRNLNLKEQEEILLNLALKNSKN